ncbi:hypothetical protein [Rossellomorea marisflavi]|uniref:hypothetical protein n=1 Tax=Rossellomorea marisflavi TaxID=189381 RepID=UPI003F9EFF11
MKTKLTFINPELKKERIILRHSPDVVITRENRSEHLNWTDSNGNKIENRDYIVIRYQKGKQVRWDKWNRQTQDDWHIGFKRTESNDEVELLLYDRLTFTWVVTLLEEMGLFKAIHIILPNKESNPILPVIVNAKGLGQMAFNTVSLLIQAPWLIYHQIRKE